MTKNEKIYQLARFNACIRTFKILRDKPKAKEVSQNLYKFIDFYGITPDDMIKARKLRRTH